MTRKIKNAVPRALLLDRVNAKDLSAKLTAFICESIQAYREFDIRLNRIGITVVRVWC